jgi:hypothetical protein
MANQEALIIKDSGGTEADVTAANALKVDGSAATQPVSAAALPLPTGAATAALQTQPGVDIGDVTVNNGAGASAVNIQDGGNSITVDGTVTITPSGTQNVNIASDAVGLNLESTQSLIKGSLVSIDAGTPAALGQTTMAASQPVVIASDQSAVPISGTVAITSATLATLAEQQTQTASLSVLDDWDESDRAKVNIIVGQAGVQGGSGTVSANTQRVVLATDVALPAGTNAIGKLAANSGVDIGDVDVTSLPALPTGTNTIGSVKITDGTDTALVTAAGEQNVLESNSAAIKVAVELLDNAISGSEMQVDVVAALPAGTNNIGDVDVVSQVPTNDVFGTGTLGALNAAVTVAANGISGCVIRLGAGLSGTVVLEGSTDGFTTSQNISVLILATGLSTSAGMTSSGYYRGINTAAWTQLRIRVSAYTSGSATGTINLSQEHNIFTVVQQQAANLNVTSTPIAITKGTQGATGFTTQELRDAGRNARHFMLDAYTAAPVAEAVQTVVQWYSNAAVAGTTQPAVVPAGKTLRLTNYSISTKSLATVGSAVVRIRANTAGLGVLASPLVFSMEAGSRAGATTVAMTGGLATFNGVFPEGMEFPAGTGLAFSMAGYGPAGVLTLEGVTRFAVYGYEY